MLIVVLALVIVALALLVVSLVIGQSLLAWLSIGVSVLAAIALVVDVLRRRKHAADEPEEEPETAESAAEEPETDGSESTAKSGEQPVGEQPAESTAVLAATPAPSGTAAPTETTAPTETPETDSKPEPVITSSGEFDEDEFDDVEPGEEETDAADLLMVSELDDIVLVIDERPRYHLPACRWVGSRATISLPIRESRDLGFTPCAVCKPDSTLAAKSRGKRGTRKPS